MAEFRPCEEACPVRRSCVHAGRCLVAHLPCPFCGGEVDPREWLAADGTYGPGCSACGATAPTMRAWDSRHGRHLQAAEVILDDDGDGFTVTRVRDVPEHVARARDRWPNAYRPWTEQEGRRLVALVREHLGNLAVVCALMGRSPQAVACRLRRLGYNDLADGLG